MVSDPERLEALRAVELLDTEPEEAFDRLVRLATAILEVPVALVSLVDDSRQFFKSCVGLPEPVASVHATPLSHSFCKHVVATGGEFVVSDAREHPVVKDNPVISDLGVVAYAGMPLTTASGHTLGSFCAIDSKPRRWTDRELAILRDLSGSVITEISLREDILERRRTESQLQSLRERHASILQSAGDGIFGVDSDGRLTFVNAAAERMLGWSADELIGRVQHEVVHYARADGSPYPVAECPIYDALHREEGTAGQELFWRRGGTALAIEYTSTPLWEGGARAGVVVCFRDVSQRRRDERLDRARHAVTEALADPSALGGSIDGALEGVGVALGLEAVAGWAHDEESGSLSCARVWRRAPLAPGELDPFASDLRLAPWEELPGRVWSSARPGWVEDMAGDEHSIRAPAAARTGLHGAVCVPVGSGPRSFGVLECVAAEVGPPEPGLIGALNTVAEQLGQHVERARIRREDQRLEARVEQTQRLESLGKLAGGIAHDFNNLLGVILNYASFVASEVEDRSVREDVDEIRRAAQRGAELTRQLLVFGRRKGGESRIVELEGVVGGIERLLRGAVSEEVRLVTIFGSDVAPIKADAGQLEQVLLNLALNARDAMPGGGTLTVAVHDVELTGASKGLAGTIAPGRYVRLLVSDTGSGMSREVASRAFEPFFTTKPTGGGTGLGLATTYGIVSAHGGHIDLDTAPGRGTTFRIYLPAAEGELAPDTLEPADDPRGLPTGSRERVLVVEDEEGVRAVASRILAEHGYSVLEASGGAEALALHLGESPVDLVLTDVVMPGMSGKELVARLRELDPTVGTLYMSGYPEGVAIEDGVAADGTPLVEKPFDPAALVSAVAAALARSPASAVSGDPELAGR